MTTTDADHEHVWAPHVRLLARGRAGARPYTTDEAEAVFSAMLAGALAPAQEGAVLALLRVRGETAAELAGFVTAARAVRPPIDGDFAIDWPSYAGFRREPPWFVLVARLIARPDRRILMHGADPRVQDRQGTELAIRALGIPVIGPDMRVHAAPLQFLPLSHAMPSLDRLLRLRELLGVRSAAHDVVRIVNVSRAALSLQPVFHPHHLELHAQVGAQLADPQTLMLKGVGGEFAVDPQRPLRLHWARLSDRTERTHDAPGPAADGPVGRTPWTLDDLQALWQGVSRNPRAEALVVATAAVILEFIDQVPWTQAQSRAEALWNDRPR